MISSFPQTYPTCTDIPDDNIDGPVCRTGGNNDESSIELGECVSTGVCCQLRDKLVLRKKKITIEPAFP